jgi:hypothetical protein
VIEVALREFCAARSGDKGDLADIGVFACDERFWEALRSGLTVERVQALFAPIGVRQVDRYEVPNLLAVKLVLHGALGGGGSASLRSDSLGKTLGGSVLRITVPLDDDLARLAPRPRPPAHPFTDRSVADGPVSG